MSVSFYLGVCFASRIVLGFLALYGMFTYLYFIVAALLACTLLYKWDFMRFCQALVWIIVYFTAGTVTALIIVLIDTAVSFINSITKPEVQPEFEESKESEESEEPEVPELSETQIETIPVVVPSVDTLTPI